MTNAQASAFFASLPPEEDAEIAHINTDTGTLQFESIRPIVDDELMSMLMSRIN